MHFYENDDDHYGELSSFRIGRYDLKRCIENHYSEPELWDEMVKRFRRH